MQRLIIWTCHYCYRTTFLCKLQLAVNYDLRSVHTVIYF